MSNQKWLPAVLCYDPNEGYFPSAIQRGADIPDYVIAHRDEEFATEQAAIDRAYEHDYEDSKAGWIEKPV